MNNHRVCQSLYTAVYCRFRYGKDKNTCTVEIYNRWGMLLFSSKGYPEEWDGTYKGRALPVAPYYYVIDIKSGDTKPFTGTVSIILRD